MNQLNGNKTIKSNMKINTAYKTQCAHSPLNLYLYLAGVFICHYFCTVYLIASFKIIALIRFIFFTTLVFYKFLYT